MGRRGGENCRPLMLPPEALSIIYLGEFCSFPDITSVSHSHMGENAACQLQVAVCGLAFNIFL